MREVEPDKLRWICDPAELPFETTKEVVPLAGAIGQPRAVQSLEFGLGIDVPGFNVFISGRPGTGRTTIVTDQLQRVASSRPTPDDWCYVYNFADPWRPISISLPSGQACVFADDMRRLVEEVRRELSRAFESRRFRQQQQELHRAVEQQRDELMQALTKRAESDGFGISITPSGPAIFPLLHGKPMSQDELALLPDEKQTELRARGEELSGALREVFEQLRQTEKQIHEQMTEQHRQAARSIVAPLVLQLQDKYRNHQQVDAYLDQVQEDLIARDLDIWRASAEQDGSPDGDGSAPGQAPPEAMFERYQVNVIVNNADVAGAPVVFENNPTYYNVFGRIEYQAHMGSMVTNFRMIKPGALHRANGGYLVLNAQELVTSPFAWASLKRSLRTQQLQIENMGDQYSAVPAATLRPDPIPINAKVVLIGPPQVYYLLHFYDEDFSELFRVRADFDTEMVRGGDTVESYAGFISEQVAQLKLRHFDRTGVAKVAEYGARLAEDQGKLSAAFNDVIDLVAEASYCAGEAGRDLVRAEDVMSAIDRKVYRGNMVQARLREFIDNGTILIDTEGQRIGQVNGLSVLSLGDYSFGTPVRITAQTALGADGVSNIERETQMSGRLHSKGFLILTSLLMGRYGQDKPIAVAARLTFEQTYDEVDGDSASCGELCCLLSSLSGLPLRQDVAITGSINQRGEVQAIGGVTQKIEGFFDVCAMRGLTGSQGVIVPTSNLNNLMLREDVVEAARLGQFHVWAVSTVDEALEILTGMPAEKVNAQVDAQLRNFAERLKAFGRGVDQGEIRERKPAVVGPRTPKVMQRRRPRGPIRPKP